MTNPDASLIDAAKRGSLEEVIASIENGADINFQEEVFRNSAFHIAASNGFLNIIKHLFENGADITLQNAVDMTPLHLAVRDGRFSVFVYLLENLDSFPELLLNDVITVARMSVYSNPMFVKMLEQFRIKVVRPSTDHLDEKDALLLNAAHDGQTEDVTRAINQGANIEVEDGRGMNPLIWASLRGQIDVIRILISRGANIEAYNFAGWTALIQASAHGHDSIVKLLLESGADVNASTRHEETALHFAAEEGYTAIVELLLEHGADGTLRDSDERLAADIAREFGHEELGKLIEGKMKEKLSRL